MKIRTICIKEFMPKGVYPIRQDCTRYFYHRSNGCYYLYDEHGHEHNLSTDDRILDLKDALIVGLESLKDDTLIPIGLRTDKKDTTYLETCCRQICCNENQYIKAFTYLGSIKDYIGSGGGGTSQYTITLLKNINAGGNVTGGGTFEVNTSRVIETTINSKYSFEGWRDTKTNKIVSSDSSYAFTVTGNRTFEAIYKHESDNFYCVTVKANDDRWGTAYKTNSYKHGSTALVQAYPKADCYFVNWTMDGEIVSNQREYSFTVTKDVTMVAVFTDVLEYVIDATTSPVGAGKTKIDSEFISTKVVRHNSIHSVEIVPNSGYKFKYWDINNGERTDTRIFINAKITDSIKYVAICESVLVTISVSSNLPTGGTLTIDNLDVSTKSVMQGTAVKVKAVAKSGYEFSHWVIGGADQTMGVEEITYIVDVNVSALAVFVVIPVVETSHLLFKTNDPNLGLVSINYADGTARIEKDLPRYSNLTIYGKASADEGVFDYFLFKDSGTKQYTTPYTFDLMEESYEIDAIFKLPPTPRYNVTLNSSDVGTSNDRGSISLYDDIDTTLDTDSVTVDKNEYVNLRAVAKDGFEFINYTDETGNVISANARFMYQVTKTIVITANFAVIPTYTITLVCDPTDGGRVRFDNDIFAPTVSKTVRRGTSVAIGTVFNPSYALHKWNDGSIAMNRNVIVDSDITYTAIYNKEHNLTVNTNDGSLGVIAMGLGGNDLTFYSGNYVKDSRITINAKPKPNCRFVSWSDGNTELTRTITMPDNDITYTATFVADTVELQLVAATTAGKVRIGSDGTADAIVTKQVTIGDSVTIYALPNPSHKFIKWSDNNTEATRTITITEALRLTATFEVDTVSIRVYVTASSGGYGRVSFNNGSQVIEGTTEVIRGSTVTITAHPIGQGEFVAWNDGNTNISRTFVANEDGEYSAEFKRGSMTINLNTGDSGGGLVKIDNGTFGLSATKTFYLGDKSILHALPNLGYRVVNWVDADSGTVVATTSTSITLEPTVFKSVFNTIVNFEMIPLSNVSTTVTCDPTARGTVTFEGTTAVTVTKEVAVGTTVRATANPDSNSVVNCWMKDGVDIPATGGSTTYDIVVGSAPATYTCKFWYLIVTPTSLTFDATGGTKTFNVDSNTEWTVT